MLAGFHSATAARRSEENWSVWLTSFELKHTTGWWCHLFTVF